jgi:hypothetical protein
MTPRGQNYSSEFTVHAPAIIDYANPSLSLCMNGRNGFAPITTSRRWLGDKVMSV